MKKKTISSLLALLGLIAVGNVATAGEIKAFVDNQNANTFLDQKGESYTFFFDLNSDTLVVGDINKEDDILTGYLLLGFKDDFDPWQAEIAILDYESKPVTIEVDTGVYVANVTGQLISDHTLQVTVTQKKGDFWLMFGKVAGDYRDNPEGGGGTGNTPEPSTLILLSLGIGSLTYAMKRRKAAKTAS